MALIFIVPFTPYHLALPFFIYTIIIITNKFHRLNIEKYSVFTLLLGSVLPDIQGFVSVFFNDNIAIHGFSHTIMGAFAYSLIYGVLLFFICKTNLVDIQKQVIILFSSISLFHILPDSFIYPEMQVFWPVKTGSIGKLANYSLVANILTKIAVIALIVQTIYLIILKLVKVD